MFSPSGSLRFTHHVKFSSSLWNTLPETRGPPRPVCAVRFCIPATPPTRALADSRPQMPTRMQATVRSGAYTTRAAAGSAGLSRSPGRPWPAEYNETRGPTRHTTDIPTCPAWTSRHRCKGASTPCSVHAIVLPAEADRRDPPRARCARRSDKTVSTTAFRHTPAVPPAAPLPKDPGRSVKRRIRPHLLCDLQTPYRILRQSHLSRALLAVGLSLLARRSCLPSKFRPCPQADRCPSNVI